MNRDDGQKLTSIDRRTFLKLSGGGALAAVAAGVVGSRLIGEAAPAEAAPPTSSFDVRLCATDGYLSFPGRRLADENGIYGFGFRGVKTSSPDETYWSIDKLIQKYKGKVQWPSPVLAVPKDDDTNFVLTNLGFTTRPDLDDSHTIHWHGFRNPNSVFDGVPEVSIAVPLGRDFPYFYRARDEGTYMYHCHFEDTEHVQMGMDGVVFVKASDPTYAYDLPGGGTPPSEESFDRQFTFMLNEIYTEAHDNLQNVQENTWSDYKADRWVMNGRSYPDTLIMDDDLAGSDFDLGDDVYSQPVSSLMQLNEMETGIIRIASLGFEQHTMQLLGIPMYVVGHDSSYLGANSYWTNSLYLGAGEARDVLFTAPAHSGIEDENRHDSNGYYDRYWFRNRSEQRLINPEMSGLGGMLTEVRVYPVDTLGTQPGPNQTIGGEL